ncbi:response regulator transcription factor [Silvibacterium dinghuense]|nr:response regulator transcription factor [Silvibacterium dinghuense]GGH00248.1 DNA-binding response regulator [Silvibacterium dinghuense]
MNENMRMTRLAALPDSGQLIPLLLIDDDRSLAALLAEYCTAAGFSISSALSGEEGILRSRQQHFFLIILDVMMPGIDGFEVLKRLRQTTNIPVLMLTTRDAGADRVRGLEGGADDYLAKPFQPEELVARIKSILRRVHPRDTDGQMTAGDLILNEAERSVTLANQKLDLTGAEYSLLRLLLLSPGEPLSREELIPRIFGREPTSFDRSIDNLVNNLRRKLGTHADGAERIKSVRNVGYCYVLYESGSGTS